MTLLEQRLDRNQFDFDAVRRMRTGRVLIGHIIPVVYGLPPLLFYFYTGVLLLVVVKCADINSFTRLGLRPIFMIF